MTTSCDTPASARALQHGVQVVVEALVAQVGADVDQVHAGFRREGGQWYPAPVNRGRGAALSLA